jgi:hypothetical protein
MKVFDTEDNSMAEASAGLVGQGPDQQVTPISKG